MSDDDLIRRGDALRVADEVFDQCQNVHGDDRGAFAAAEVGARIAALPAVTVGVPLKQIGTGLYEQPAPNPAAIREAWEKAYWRMRSYAVHDNDCKLNKPPHFDGPCSCGLTAALEDALALIQMEEQK